MTDFWESFSAPKIHFLILYSETAPFILFAWTWLPSSSRFSNYVYAAEKWIIHPAPCLCIWSLYSGLYGAGIPRLNKAGSPGSSRAVPERLQCPEPAVSLLHNWHPTGLTNATVATEDTEALCKHLTATKAADSAKVAKFHWAAWAEQVTDTKEAPQLQELWHTSGIMAQNWQLGVPMETTTAGSRAGREGHRGMKTTGRVKYQ